MNPKHILTIAVTLMVGVILIAGVLTPVIADTSSTTTSIDNEGAQWVRMAYVSDDTDYSVSVDVDGDVTITNGGNVQTGSVTDMIVYADSLCSVFISDGDIILVGSNGNSTQMIRLDDSFTIERASGVLTIGDGTSVYQPSGSVEWAYVPIGTGAYGSFGAGGLQRDQTPLVAVGSFAGVGCYNDLITPDYGLVMDADVTSEYINSVKWTLGLGGQGDDGDDDAEQVVEQTDPSPSPTLTVPDSPEPDTDGGVDPVLMGVSPETDAGDTDGDAEPTRGETEGSGGLRSAPSYTYTDGDWGYNVVSSRYAQVVYYLGTGGDVSIPTSLGGYTVYKIGLGGEGKAVFDTSLAIGNLTITNGWTSPVTINTYAFYGCNITGTLQLIGEFALNDYAFANTGIIWADPVIGNPAKWGKNVFENCTGMTGTLTVNSDYQFGNYCFKGTGITKVIVNKVNPVQVPDSMFGYMPNLTEIEWNWDHTISKFYFRSCPIERIIITSGGIGEDAFCDLSALEYVSISGISTFDGSTFERCPLLSTVVLSSTITTIGGTNYYGSFNNCPSLTDINLGNVTSIYNSFNTCASLVDMDLSSVSTIKNSFRYSSLTSLSLSATRVEGSFSNSSLTEISLPNATYVSGFESCSSLTKVTLSENLTTIPQRGFYGTPNIKELTLPISTNIYFGNDYTCFGSVNKLEKITFLKGTGVGYNYTTSSAHRYDKAVWIRCASKLTSVTFESGITRIGDNMFRGMTSMPAITLPATLESIGNYSFFQCTGLTGTLSLPDALVSIGDYAFSFCTGCTGTLTLPSSLTTIGTSAFAKCTGFTGSLVIPASVTSLGAQAFSGCNGLTGSLSIPSNVGSIGNSVFSTCTGLSGTLTISDGISSIGLSAFEGCGFTGILTIPDSVLSIGSDAFKNCTGFTSLSCPISLSSAGCFTNVSNLTSITLTGTGDSADYTESDYQTTPQYISRANLTTVTISEGVTSAGDYLLAGCSNVTSLTIPSTLTEIGDYAFYQCAGLTGAFALPQGVTSVGDYAFDGCGYSGELDIGNMSTIGDHAFSGCTFTGTLILPAGLTSVGNNAFSDSSFDNMIVMSDATPSSDAFSGMAVRQVLNLSDAEYTKTSYGLNANEVRDEIDADSYICVVSYEETVYKEGATYSLLPVIPLVAVAGLVIGVGVSVMRRGGE